jgi:hypothetical protein
MAASAADNTTTKKESESLRIVEPKANKIISDETTVKAVVSVGNGIRPKSLRITLNGKNVTRHAQEEDCGPQACRWAVELTKADRLLSGQNQLVASARGSHDSIKVTSAKFGYYYGLQAGQNQPQWPSPSVGLSLNSGGAQPWVTLTTGWPANMQDNLDPTQYSVPYRDATFPTANDTQCSGRYQVVVLNRHTPMIEDAYRCFKDGASLKSQLATLNKGTELVLVGTTEGNNADSSLDTTSIGGTNYSSSNSWQPMGYAAIGISGAAPGSAYESYYLSSDVGKPYQTNPFANGLLALDQNSNYNFHPGNNVQFEVYPNDPQYGSSDVFIAAGGQVTGWFPPVGSTNGFWLLTLDRVTLLPIDFSQGSCNSNSGNCGQFFNTGSTDSGVASKAVGDLAFTLEGPTSRQLVVLTTVGQPFQSASAASALVGTPTLRWYGASPYTMELLTAPTSTYTLVAPGPQTSPIFSTEITWRSPFSRGVVNSSSTFSQQGQTGFVRGVMARDNNGLYYPAVVSQEDGKMNGDGATALSIDYDFYSISTQNNIDWPLTDTPGHIAAYHWASAKFLGNHYGENGALSQDVRYFYAGSPEMGQYNTDFQCPNSIANSPCNYPGDGYGFTSADLAIANGQLYKELTALNDTYNYLGEPGILGVINGNNGPSIADEVITATYQVLKDQTMAVNNNTSVQGEGYAIMNLLAGVATIVGAAIGPEAPLAAAAFGVTSGVLWTGSAYGPWEGNNTVTPPTYESTFDTTLGQLESNASTYETNLVTSYKTALDGIYSDPGKLSAIGAKIADSGSGWHFNNQLTSVTVAQNLQAAAQRSMYVQLLPKFYQLDAYTNQPVSSAAMLGLFGAPEDVNHGGYDVTCTATYPSSTTSNPYATRAYPSSASPAKTDIYVMGGSISNQYNYAVSESLPSGSLLNIVFGSDSGEMNIPLDLVYSPNMMANRPGPDNGDPTDKSYWNELNWGVNPCYKPSCSEHTYDPPNKSSCVGP